MDDENYAWIASSLRALASNNVEVREAALMGAGAIDALRQRLASEKRRAQALEMSARGRSDGGLREALRAIAAQETPHANATTKRMARMAREAIGS